MTTLFFGRSLIRFLALAICVGNGYGQGTQESAESASAYTALRLVGKTLGRDALDRVIEVSGRDGVPQPYLWKITLREGTGSRELDVAAGKIAAQRVISSPPTSTSAIRLQELNLDSSGAFDATESQARKVRLRFDSLNYVLKIDEKSGKPLWAIDLIDREGSSVGNIRIAAHDGTVVATNGRLAGNAPAVVRRSPTLTPTATPRVVTETTTITSVQATDPDERTETVVTEKSTTDYGEGGLFTRTGRTLDKTQHTVEHHLRRAGATVQRFFTGHSDLEENDRRD